VKREECKNCAIKSRAVGTLDDNELDFLNKNCAEVILKKNESIIYEGKLSSHIAYIKSGLAKVHMTGPSGRDQILKIVPPGSYIGIQTILSQRIHKYSASALMDSKVCYIDNYSFRELLKRNHEFAFEIIIYLCQDELSYFERFVNLSQKQVNGRLADAILFFANEIYKEHKFNFILTRNDLAAWIGVTRESATRALKELSDIGVIKSDAKTIEILNYDRLLRISENG
jgi:CRP/FNR family transcriptional regulator